MVKISRILSVALLGFFVAVPVTSYAADDAVPIPQGAPGAFTSVVYQNPTCQNSTNFNDPNVYGPLQTYDHVPKVDDNGNLVDNNNKPVQSEDQIVYQDGVSLTAAEKQRRDEMKEVFQTKDVFQPTKDGVGTNFIEKPFYGMVQNANNQINNDVFTLNCNSGVGFFKQMLKVTSPVSITSNPVIMKISGITQTIALSCSALFVIFYGLMLSVGYQRLDPVKFILRFFFSMLAVYYLPYFIQDLLNLNNMIVYSLGSMGYDVSGVNGGYWRAAGGTATLILFQLGMTILSSIVASGGLGGLVWIAIALLFIVFLIKPFLQIFLWWYTRLLMICFLVVIGPLFVIMLILPQTASLAKKWINAMIAEIFSQTIFMIAFYLFANILKNLVSFNKALDMNIIGDAILFYGMIAFLAGMPELAKSLLGGGIQNPALNAMSEAVGQVTQAAANAATLANQQWGKAKINKEFEKATNKQTGSFEKQLLGEGFIPPSGGGNGSSSMDELSSGGGGAMMSRAEDAMAARNEINQGKQQISSSEDNEDGVEMSANASAIEEQASVAEEEVQNELPDFSSGQQQPQAEERRDDTDVPNMQMAAGPVGPVREMSPGIPNSLNDMMKENERVATAVRGLARGRMPREAMINHVKDALQKDYGIQDEKALQTQAESLVQSHENEQFKGIGWDTMNKIGENVNNGTANERNTLAEIERSFIKSGMNAKEAKDTAASSFVNSGLSDVIEEKSSNEQVRETIEKKRSFTPAGASMGNVKVSGGIPNMKKMISDDTRREVAQKRTQKEMTKTEIQTEEAPNVEKKINNERPDFKGGINNE